MFYPSRVLPCQGATGIQKTSGLDYILAHAQLSDDMPSIVLIRILMFFFQLIAVMATRLCTSSRHLPSLFYRLYTFLVASANIPDFQTETGSSFTTWPLVGRSRKQSHRHRRPVHRPRLTAMGQLLPARVVCASRVSSFDTHTDGKDRTGPGLSL